jgi:hypothetical protein
MLRWHCYCSLFDVSLMTMMVGVWRHVASFIAECKRSGYCTAVKQLTALLRPYSIAIIKVKDMKKS